jgi:hypothetical protein
MMRLVLSSRARIAMALAIACLFSLHPAQARTYHRTMTYETAGTGLARTNLPDRTCDGRGHNCRISPDGGVDLGAVIFPPVGGRGFVNITLAAKDAINAFGRVTIEACEDFDEDGSCTLQTAAAPGDRRVVYACLGPGQKATLFKVARALPVIVYVYAAWGCTRYLADVVAKTGGGTTGSITETWTS